MFDVVISNPPYISREAFRKETTRSVRNWEPKLALVPHKHPAKGLSTGVDPADIFYHRLLELHSQTFKSSVLLMEVGDKEQALRVVKMAIKFIGTSNHIEIWADNPGTDVLEDIYIDELKIPVRGTGAFRAVSLLKYSAPA